MNTLNIPAVLIVFLSLLVPFEVGAAYNANITSLTHEEVTINWSSNPALHSSYNLYQRIEDDLELVVTVSSSLSSYTLTNLTPSTPYQYIIRANYIDPDHEVDVNNDIISFTTLNAPIPILIGTLVTARNNGAKVSLDSDIIVTFYDNGKYQSIIDGTTSTYSYSSELVALINPEVTSCHNWSGTIEKKRIHTNLALGSFSISLISFHGTCDGVNTGCFLYNDDVNGDQKLFETGVFNGCSKLISDFENTGNLITKSIIKGTQVAKYPATANDSLYLRILEGGVLEKRQANGTLFRETVALNENGNDADSFNNGDESKLLQCYDSDEIIFTPWNMGELHGTILHAKGLCRGQEVDCFVHKQTGIMYEQTSGRCGLLTPEYQGHGLFDEVVYVNGNEIGYNGGPTLKYERFAIIQKFENVLDGDGNLSQTPNHLLYAKELEKTSYDIFPYSDFVKVSDDSNEDGGESGGEGGEGGGVDTIPKGSVVTSTIGRHGTCRDFFGNTTHVDLDGNTFDGEVFKIQGSCMADDPVKAFSCMIVKLDISENDDDDVEGEDTGGANEYLYRLFEGTPGACHGLKGFFETHFKFVLESTLIATRSGNLGDINGTREIVFYGTKKSSDPVVTLAPEDTVEVGDRVEIDIGGISVGHIVSSVTKDNEKSPLSLRACYNLMEGRSFTYVLNQGEASEQTLKIDHITGECSNNPDSTVGTTVTVDCYKIATKVDSFLAPTTANIGGCDALYDSYNPAQNQNITGEAGEALPPRYYPVEDPLYDSVLIEANLTKGLDPITHEPLLGSDWKMKHSAPFAGGCATEDTHIFDDGVQITSLTSYLPPNQLTCDGASHPLDPHNQIPLNGGWTNIGIVREASFGTETLLCGRDYQCDISSQQISNESYIFSTVMPTNGEDGKPGAWGKVFLYDVNIVNAQNANGGPGLGGLANLGMLPTTEKYCAIIRDLKTEGAGSIYAESPTLNLKVIQWTPFVEGPSGVLGKATNQLNRTYIYTGLSEGMRNILKKDNIYNGLD